MRLNSLRAQFILTIILICLVIALIFSGLWVQGTQECLKNGIQRSSSQDSRLLAGQAGAYFEKSTGPAMMIASDPNTAKAITSNDTGRIITIADRLKASVPQADFIQIANKNGTILYGTRPSNITNLGTYTWYATADKSVPYVTGLYYSSVTGKDVISAITPVKDGGAIVGYIVTALSPESLNGVIQLPGSNPSSNVLLFDSGGRLVSHDNGTYVETRTNVSVYQPVLRALRGEQGVVEHSDTWDGQPRISAFSPISGMGWGVVASTPTGVAYRPLRDQLFLVLSVLLLLIAGFSAFGFYASKRLSDPIVSLSDSVRRAYLGNYDVKLDVTRKDEIGDLARTFNDIKAEIKIKDYGLRNVSERFQMLVRDLPVGILLTGARGEYIGSNSAMLNMFGISEDELADKAVFDPDWALWKAFKSGGKAMPREAHPILMAYAARRPVMNEPIEAYRQAPGDTVWLKVSADPQLADDGTVKSVICTFVDVTERRLLEEALTLSRFSIDSAIEEIFWITPEGRFYYVNDAACNSLGYTRDRLLSKSVWDVDPGFSRENWPLRWNEFKETGEVEFESVHLADGGTSFPVEARARYVESQGREYVCMFAGSIAELKRAEEALHSIEADLSRAQKAAHIGSYARDIGAGRTSWSDELYRIFGMAPGETPSSFDEYMSTVHPDDRKMVEGAIDEALSGKRYFGADHRLRLRDGSTHYVHSAGEVAFDQAGKAARVYGTIQDITGLKLIEIDRDGLKKRLSSERARLDAVLRNIPAGIVIAEAPSGRIVTINRQMEEIFRHRIPISSRIEEYGEWSVFQSGGHRYEPEDTPLARSIQKGEIVLGEEINFLRGDGTWGIISINSAPIYDEEDRIVDAIATFFDITERKTAENALRESESNLTRAQLIAHLGNWVWDIEKNAMRYSDEAYRIYGIVPKDYGSTFEAFMGLVHPEDRELVRRSINAALNRKEPHSIDFRIIRPDGVERFLHSEGEVAFDAAGRPIKMFGTVHDITERKQVEEALRDAKSQAELYLDLISHDINNMNMIGIGYLELALGKLKLDEEGRTLLSKPLEVLKNSSALIDNVRKTRKAITGELRLVPIDVGSMLEEVKKEYELAPEEGVTIRYTLVKDCYVMANELLKDVFTNLLDNSIKHSGRPVVIGIDLTRASEGGIEYYKISIEDNGPGIPDELKDKLFVRMKRGETKAMGTGLGLYLVKTLVESFNGKVWVEDRVPGDYKKGSKFVVMLPAAHE